MAAIDIQAKIKKGLARAVNKTGSSASDLVYLVKETKTGGTLVEPPTITKSNILLLNAIFTEYDKKTFDVNILAGDRKLVCDSDVILTQGDTIKQGAVFYKVIGVDDKAPTSIRLAQIAQVRKV